MAIKPNKLNFKNGYSIFFASFINKYKFFFSISISNVSVFDNTFLLEWYRNDVMHSLTTTSVGLKVRCCKGDNFRSVPSDGQYLLLIADDYVLFI